MPSKLETLRLTARALWCKACQHDNIPESAKFVTFSPDNPYEKDFNDAAIRLMECRAKLELSTL